MNYVTPLVEYKVFPHAECCLDGDTDFLSKEGNFKTVRNINRFFLFDLVLLLVLFSRIDAVPFFLPEVVEIITLSLLFIFTAC